MRSPRVLSAFAVVSSVLTATCQQAPQPQLKIDPSNRTLSVTTTETVSVEPDLAILHIGFDTQPEDAKTAYADGARISNAIISALKQAGVAEPDIRSESQFLQRDFTKIHKFKLTQQWTVRVDPPKAAEILDIAVTNGATTSGDIEWTVKDEHALEAKALDRASTRARENAEVLAKGLSVRLGAPIYITNQLTTITPRPMMMNAFAADRASLAPPPPLAIEPHKVSREATVYAVFAIE
ncbi:SIMPL domain-containing protein [Telmatobacter sp. DSM 110680]|uniref:SIMPL domain-containing protein n=1 Tax=Telmatobacter sp. DSM 110680 TaxID=3036704 RepID=A0AAU7DIQ4_9BACT